LKDFIERDSEELRGLEKNLSDLCREMIMRGVRLISELIDYHYSEEGINIRQEIDNICNAVVKSVNSLQGRVS
jgi:hypothetical protein